MPAKIIEMKIMKEGAVKPAAEPWYEDTLAVAYEPEDFVVTLE